MLNTFHDGLRRPGLAIIACVAWSLCSFAVRADEAEKASTGAANAESSKEAASKPPKTLFSGKVVLVQEALARRGVTAFEELKDQVALETTQGALLPIIPDWRGRAFFQDKRLRDRQVDLIGTRRNDLPYLQVLVVYFIDDEGNREYMDYWCDICSIPMYEIKPCDCCQGDIRLRLQPRELPDYITGETKAAEPGNADSTSDSGE